MSNQTVRDGVADLIRKHRDNNRVPSRCYCKQWKLSENGGRHAEHVADMMLEQFEIQTKDADA